MGGSARPTAALKEADMQRLDYESTAAEGLRALGGVHRYVAKSGLSPALIDLAYLRVSQINGCPYCIDMHTRDAMKHDVAVEKLMLVSAWRDTGALFSPQERAALQWAEALTLIAQTGAPDADYQAAAAQFGEKDLVDLTIAIGLMNAYNRIAIGFRRGPDITSPR
jgi:AhpD family alkylhydroperoxidase